MSVRRKIDPDHYSGLAETTDSQAVSPVSSEAIPSPALAMQASLEARFAAPKRWRPLATIGFVVATCGGFWSAVAWGLGRLLHS